MEPVSAPPISRVILYVRDIPKVADFYQRIFGMSPLPGATDGWLELAGPAGGTTIALHRAAISQKSGAAMKLVFAVADIPAFITAGRDLGAQFGPVHEVDGIAFANSKDPAGNAIQISSRGLHPG
jgi:predicted enzyme related to lactoylglutathione lyase